MTNVIDGLYFMSLCINSAWPYKASTHQTTRLHGIARFHCSVSNSNMSITLIFKE